MKTWGDKSGNEASWEMCAKNVGEGLVRGLNRKVDRKAGVWNEAGIYFDQTGLLMFTMY